MDPKAYYDALSIGLRLQQQQGKFSAVEVHLFSYLSCLLWLYRGKPATDWGYTFAVTKYAYPYSPEIDASLTILADLGFLRFDDDSLQVTEQGQQEYYVLSIFSQFTEREPFIDGACSSLLALPLGIIWNALMEEPEIKSSVSVSQSRNLLTDSGLDSLYEQFRALSGIIGVDIDDLMVPSVIWLQYLKDMQE
jgi:hypothetical protein